MPSTIPTIVRNHPRAVGVAFSLLTLLSTSGAVSAASRACIRGP